MCLLKYCLIIGWKCLEEVKWCNPASSTKVSDILRHVRADRINKVLLKPKHMVAGGTCWADVEKGEKKTYVVYGISTDSCPDASSCFDHFWFKITVSNGNRVRTFIRRSDSAQKDPELFSALPPGKWSSVVVAPQGGDLIIDAPTVENEIHYCLELRIIFCTRQTAMCGKCQTTKAGRARSVCAEEDEKRSDSRCRTCRENRGINGSAGVCVLLTTRLKINGFSVVGAWRTLRLMWSHCCDFIWCFDRVYT